MPTERISSIFYTHYILVWRGCPLCKSRSPTLLQRYREYQRKPQNQLRKSVLKAMRRFQQQQQRQQGGAGGASGAAPPNNPSAISA